MPSPSTPSETLAASRDLLALLPELDADVPSLAASTPERQRLSFTAWIARARADGAVLRGTWADRQVGRVAERLHRLSRLWWPGRVAALDPLSTPASAWPGVSLESWRAVASWCLTRLETAERWADDTAREPPPHDASALFAAACDQLRTFGGPLGDAVRLDRASPSLAIARRQHPRLLRLAAELRWLRGVAPDEPWGLAIGRLRGLARALQRDGEAIAALLAPALVPLEGWAVHLGRDPAREWVLGRLPAADVTDAALTQWLVRAFDVFDTPALAAICVHLRARLGALQPEFSDRRHRRRLDQLVHQLAPRIVPTTPKQIQHPGRPISDVQADAPRLAEMRAQLHGRRVLFATNRSASEIELFLSEQLGLECEAVASADSPRRRQALLQRIRRGAYDIVLVAHGFTGHADTEQLGEACRQAGIFFCAVDKGRPARILAALWSHRHHPRLAGPAAARGSAA